MNGQTKVTCSNMNESYQHDFKQKWGTNKYIQYDSMYIKIKKRKTNLLPKDAYVLGKNHKDKQRPCYYKSQHSVNTRGKEWVCNGHEFA